MTYPPQGQPHGQGNAWRGAPPPRGRSSVLGPVAVVVVAAMIGLGLLGFVEPGFFLSDDDTEAGVSSDGGGGEASAADDSPAAAAFAAVTTAIRERDTATLTETACADADADVDSAITSVDSIDITDVADVRAVSDTEAVGEVTVGDRPFAITLRAEGADWCWYDIEPSGSDGAATTPEPDDPSGTGSGPAADPAGYLNDFLDAVNDRDLDRIETLSCGDLGSDDPSIADLFDDSGVTPLVLDPGSIRTSGDQDTIDGTFSGVEQDRGPISGLVGGRDDDGTWCIDTFSW